MRYILDTDHITFLLGGDAKVEAAVSANIRDLAVSIISVQENFNGWVGRLNLSQDEAGKLLAYAKLRTAVRFFHTVEIASYTEAASAIYQRLIRDHPVLAKRRLENDVRIAAIALSLGATIVTRNRKDFELVPGLVIEDWSQ
jgi:tRNA(fMet)-specific endonuclease VapC